MNVLFVCSGNTCRSPLAVAAWQAFDAAERKGENTGNEQAEDRAPEAGITIGSAGLAAHAGAPASPHTIEAARDWNLDLSAHRARRLDEKLARKADLICTMTQEQAATVRARFPFAAQKVRVLGEYAGRDATNDLTGEHERLARLLSDGQWTESAGGGCDIADPFGGSVEAYRSCAAQIRRAVAALRAALREGSSRFL